MEFAVDSFTISINHLKSMAAITIHVGMTIWNTTVTEQETNLVGGLWTEGNEVPKHVWILETNMVHSNSVFRGM